MSATRKAAKRSTRTTPSTAARPGSASAATADGSPSGRHGKFNANGQHIDGVWFASEGEAERYLQLRDMEAAGKIEKLETQPGYQLVVNNRLICVYRADFRYYVLDPDGRQLRQVVEDVKGMLTPEFKLKHKLFDALQPTPLSLVEIKGKARHPVRPKLSDKTGNPVGSVAGWLDLHWKGRIPV